MRTSDTEGRLQVAKQLLAINDALEGPPGDLREAVGGGLGDWNECLWGVDATEEISTESTMNEMHLRFLLIARARWRLHDAPRGASLSSLLDSDCVHLFPEPIEAFTLRQLIDVTQNLQTEWAVLMQNEDPDRLCETLDELMLQFGWFASRMHDPDVLDCPDMVEERPGGRRFLSKTAVRTFSAFFYVTYRHVHLASTCIELAEGEPLEFELHSHLITASLDEFYRLSMYYDMRVGSILQYRHEFTGMFHSITQVMYWNNPCYERRRQLPQADILRGEQAESILPLVTQLYPDVRVLLEDDPLPRGFPAPGSATEWDAATPMPRGNEDWIWIVLPGRVYLACSTGHVFYCRNMIPTLNLLHRSLG